MAGYDGYSMSNNARSAYADGEMPKSKWTKGAMLAYFEELADSEDRIVREDVRKMKKDELFKKFFERSSWHHTSKLYNRTNFYSFTGTVEDISREKTADEIEAEDRQNEIFRAQYEAETEQRRERARRAEAIREAGEKFKRTFGVRYDTIAGYAILFPDEIVTRISKKGVKLFRHIGADENAWCTQTSGTWNTWFRNSDQIEARLIEAINER